MCPAICSFVGASGNSPAACAFSQLNRSTNALAIWGILLSSGREVFCFFNIDGFAGDFPSVFQNLILRPGDAQAAGDLPSVFQNMTLRPGGPVPMIKIFF